jgi:hypothetical protein
MRPLHTRERKRERERERDGEWPPGGSHFEKAQCLWL